VGFLKPKFGDIFPNKGRKLPYGFLFIDAPFGTRLFSNWGVPLGHFSAIFLLHRNGQQGQAPQGCSPAMTADLHKILFL